MPKLPRANSKKVLAALERAGFYIHHQSGEYITLEELEHELDRQARKRSRKTA
jgi:predicted RNA binding protein YcfA (HicA-like mRNA interferase family)